MRNVAKMMVACLAVAAVLISCGDDKEKEKTLVSIVVTTQPTKTTYNVDEEFDMTGMVVTATYSDKSEKPVTITAAMLGYDFSTVGTKTVTITYKGETTEVTGITVTADETDTEVGVVINGITWATRNVAAPGQFVNSPEDVGMVYQWGSNVAWSNADPLTASDGNNTWRNLSETGNTWTAAKKPCPTGWRLPTRDELQSLISAGHTYTDNYNETGIAGRVFGIGDNTIFLPAVNAHRGYVDGLLYYQSYNFSYYWSSTPHESDNTKAWLLYFNFNDSYVYTEEVARAAPFFIRCVKE